MARGTVAQLAAVLAGIALMAAPAAGGYSGGAAADVHRAVGPFAAAIAVTALWPALGSLRWVNVALGAVLLVAPVVVDHDTSALAAAVVGGAVLVASAFVAPPVRHRTGGGWRELVEDW